MAVFLGKIVRAYSINCDATSHMNGLRILHFWHETGLMVEVALPLSSSHLELITPHNSLEYMQIAIIKTEAADLVKINICVIVKTFGHDST